MNANERAARRRYIRRVASVLRTLAILAVIFGTAFIVGSFLK